jgi:phosphatidylinositol alpha-mannosyltransferase
MSSYYLPSESKIGAGYMAHRLAQVMAERGHDVTMFSPCAKPEDAIYEHTLVAMTGSLRTFRWAIRLRQLDFAGFDVIHVHGDNHLRPRRWCPAVVRTMHGSCFSEALHIKGTKARLRMFALGLTEIIGSLRADATVAVSDNTRHFYPWVKRVIPNGVDLALFHPGQKEAEPTIVFVGTYEQRKRGRLLMDAFARDVLPAVPDAKLWMVCSDAPPAPHVEVLGRLSDDELADRYRRAWVFCLPSSYEGFGVPYIEAMASGTAVVATKNVGSVEVLGDGSYGRLVAGDALGRALVDLLTNGGERERLAMVAHRQSRDYDWDVVADAYERLYGELLSCSKQDPRPPGSPDPTRPTIEPTT